MEETTGITKKPLTSIFHNFFSQIVIPIFVAIVVGLFTYFGTIESIKLSNSNNLNISKATNETLLETIDRTNKNNQDIAQKGNQALLESVEKSNLTNRELSDRNYKLELEKLKEEFKLRENEKSNEEKQNLERSLNFLISDINSRISLLSQSYMGYGLTRKSYAEMDDFKDIEELRNFVILYTVEPIIQEIHLTVQDLNTDKILYQIDKLPLEISTPILLFYRTLDYINRITILPNYIKIETSYEEYTNSEYNKPAFLRASDDTKISALISELKNRNNKILPIIFQINQANANGFKALIEIYKHKKLSSRIVEADDIIEKISKQDHENYHIYPDVFLKKIEKLKK